MGTPRNLSKLAENTDSSGVLGIASGGTGGSTAAAAKSALNLHAVASSGSYADLNNKPTTANITENTNLYYTDARARAAVSVSGSLSYNSTTGVFSYTTPSTSGITEGTNLYFTDARVRAAVSAGTNLSYNSSTGVFSTTLTQYTDALARAAVSAGTGLSYNSTTGVFSTSLTQYTDALARAAVSASGSLSYNSTTGVFSYTTPSTSGIAEGSNLYYTDARARAAHSAGTGISYNSTTGAISSTITQYTDALARAAVSAGTGLSYNSTTGVFTNTITQYTDALAVSANTSAIATAKSEAIASAATDATNKANAAQAAAISAVTNGAGAAFDTLKEIQDAMATDAELAAAIASITVGNATQTIAAGTGLSGGGSFTANQTAASTVTLGLGTAGTSGTYTKVTTDAYGRVTSGTTLSSGDIPSLSGIYLPLAGGTLTGKLKISLAGGTTPSNFFEINNTAAAVGNRAGMQMNTGPSWSTTIFTEQGAWWHAFGSDVGAVRWGYDGTDLKVGSNTVLHAGNYNSYSPTLTGTGASGTWNINITGTAGSAILAPNYLPISGGTMTGIINMAGTQIITTAGYAGIEYYNAAGTWQGYIGTEDNAGNLRYNSRLGTHRWYANSTSIGAWDASMLSVSGAVLTTTGASSWGVYSNTNGVNQSGIWFSTNVGELLLRKADGSLSTRIAADGSYAFINNNNILHAGNYNSYAPTLTGGGASGTWGINITGSAGSAGSATTSTETYRGIIQDTRAGLRSPNAYDDYRTHWEFTDQIVGGDWHTAMTMQGWHDGYAAWQIIGPASTSAHENFYLRSGINTSWNSVRTILHSGNYSSYALPLSGGALTGNVTLNTSDGEILVTPTGWRSSDRAAIKIRSKANAPAEIDLRHTVSGVESGWHISARDTSSASELHFYRFNMNSAGAADSAGSFLQMFTFRADGSFNTAGAITQSGSQVLTAGNYSSYALPISGGTLTGTLYFTDTTNGFYKSGGRLNVRSESTDNVAEYASYGLYLPKSGQAAGLYVESPIEARGGLRLGNSASSGTITVGATTDATANRLVQRDSNGHINAAYVFGTYFNSSAGNSENPTIGQVWTQSTGDNYLRKSTPAHFISQLSLLTTSNYSSYALPLSGGTLSGVLTLVSSGTAINISGQSDSFGYNATAGLGTYIKGTGATYIYGGGKFFDGAASRDLLHANNFSSYAVPLSGGTMSGRLTISPGWTTSGRNYSNEWIEFGNSSGLYSPINSAHFYPNNAVYGAWRSAGTRNGWGGIEFDASNGNVTLMMGGDSNTTGFHNNNSGWQFRWASGEMFVYKNSYGGGVAATVLDSSNYNSYALPLSGGGLTGNLGVLRKRLTFSSTAGDANHSIYNNYDNIDGEGSFDGMKMNVYAGLRIRTGNASGATPTEIVGLSSSAVNISTTTNVYGPAMRQGNNLARPNASWGSTGATGMVIFKLPGSSGNYGMVHMVFDIYEYNSNSVSTVIVGGHNWASSWYNTGANVIGQCAKQVRLGYKDGQYCIVFGDSGSYWEYGTIVLRKIHNGDFYNNIMDLGAAVSVQFTATESFSNIGGDLRALRTPASFNAGGAITQAGNQVLHAGNYQSYLSTIRTGRHEDTDGTFVFRVGSGSLSSGRRHINLADTNADPSDVTGGSGITWGSRSDSAPYYMIWKRDPYNNGNSTHTRLVLSWHTGIEIGADPAYGGTRFFNGNPGVYGSEIMSVGRGDSNIRVTNTIYAYGYRGNANVAGTGEAVYAPAGVYSTGTNWLYGTIITNGNGIDAGGASCTLTATRANRANGNFYIDDNYGNGVVGAYSSYRYQGVFAMGDSYKLPADGTSTGSLYGMAWSHPNAGGAAGNLTDHGLLIINAGAFKCAISNSIVASANITAYSDERLKTNWRSMPDNFVARLAQVRVGIYDRIDEEDTTQVGVSAQSFQELLPQAIMTAKDEMGTLSVSYGNAALASAVELAKEVVDLKTRVAQLEALINKLIKD